MSKNRRTALKAAVQSRTYGFTPGEATELAGVFLAWLEQTGADSDGPGVPPGRAVYRTSTGSVLGPQFVWRPGYRYFHGAFDSIYRVIDGAGYNARAEHLSSTGWTPAYLLYDYEKLVSQDGVVELLGPADPECDEDNR